MIGERQMRKEEIAAVLGLPHPYKIRSMLDCCHISVTEIARRHAERKDGTCSPAAVSQFLKGRDSNTPIMLTIYAMLQDALGVDCPNLEALFDLRTAPSREACNG